jgi:nicotinamide-nucleotide amidase
MKTEIITIGDEILLGHTVDSNAAYIADRISEAGADVIRITTIGDADSKIVDIFREALGRADLIITTGGLGPTDDDLTKHAICRAFNRKLAFHQEILDLISERYTRRGMAVSRFVRTQADQPEGAILFENPIGSAVGILIEEKGKRLISLPGVPMEMKAIMEESVIPYLNGINHGFNVLFRNIQTFGTFESYLSEMLKQSNFTHEGCELAYLPSLKGVVLRLTYRGEDKQHGEKLLSEYAAQMIKLLGDYYVCDDGRSLLEVTTELLKAKKKTVATAESCTGGMIAAALTDISGSSEYFPQGVVTYSNEAKTDLLDVPQEILVDYGAVSEQTVHYMAENMRLKAGTDYAIAVSGIAGPTGGTEEKPVGLIYIGLAYEGGVDIHRHVFGIDRNINRERTVYTALNYLRLKLLES